MAALLVTVALVGVWRAAATLFGSRAGLCTAALGAVTGPVLALGHLAVIDAPAAAGLGVALWSVAELWRRDHRAWLIAGAAAYAFAVLGKYPVAACGLPLALLLVALRGRRAAMDLTLFAAVVAAVLGTYFLTERTQLAGFVGWRTANNPTFGVTPAMVAFSQLWYGGLPVLLALGGWLVPCRRKKLGATPLLVGAVPFPLYALLTGSSVGDTKHVVFGFLFILPLAGVLRGPASRAGRPGAVVAPLVLAAGAGAFGVHQAALMDRGWIDLGPAPRTTWRPRRSRARLPLPDRQLLALHPAAHLGGQGAIAPGRSMTPTGWPTTSCRRAYLPGRLVRGRPGRRARGRRCVRRKVAACGTFKKVYAEGESVTNIGRDLSFVTWDGPASRSIATLPPRHGKPG